MTRFSAFFSFWFDFIEVISTRSALAVTGHAYNGQSG
jgi:hypothetical protein